MHTMKDCRQEAHQRTACLTSHTLNRRKGREPGVQASEHYCVKGVSSYRTGSHQSRSSRLHAAISCVKSPNTCLRAHAARTGNNPVVRENSAIGSDQWPLGRDGLKGVTDDLAQIQGYASATSASHGESIDFHIASHVMQKCTIAVYRIGHYGAVGARHLLTSEPIKVKPQKKPEAQPETGLISCDWPVSWTLEIPKTWVSGIFLAVFTSQDGHRSYTPFVVRDTARRSDVLMVVPFTTYQAYNMWPLDGHTGKNLYKGYTADGEIGGNPERAFKVSFDRPYMQLGLPRWFDMDMSAARWAESSGYDITYATSVDLHEGRIDPSQYTAIVFSGHDEYWSKQMRDCAEDAVDAGTHLAFLASNNIYFHIRLEPAAEGKPSRVVTCYKEAPDPEPGGQARPCDGATSARSTTRPNSA